MTKFGRWRINPVVDAKLPHYTCKEVIMCNICQVSPALWRGQDITTGAVFYGSSREELVENWRDSKRD